MRPWPLLFLLTAAAAQTPALPVRAEATGSVVGHIYCSDTNEPARFAKVFLEPVPQEPKLTSTDAASINAVAAKPSTAQRTDTVSTTLDGSFSLAKVHPGAYYVIVDETGYINPRNLFTDKQLSDPSPEVRDELARKLTRVVVEANQTEVTEVLLERGASISGTVLYDDGSPAASVWVQLLHKDRDGHWIELPRNGNTITTTDTDDRGYYRIASLLADEYMVEATLQLVDSKNVVSNVGGNQIQYVMQSFRFSLSFYGNGTPRIDGATGVKLGASQSRTGQDMTLPIAKLHKLSGRVLAGADSHPVNAATVALVDRDTNKQLVSADVEREDGLFHFAFVPDGDYILRISNARDVVWEPAQPQPGAGSSPFPQPDKERVLAKYGGADQPLLLSGDMYGVNATVPPSRSSNTQRSTGFRQVVYLATGAYHRATSRN